MKSNTLVIHPRDLTTDCLSVIYEGRDWDVIRDYNTTHEEIRQAIESHDRIIMLGHGSPFGLLAGADTKFGFVRFDHYIVDDKHAAALRGKETISIWCHSNEYFKRHKLTGLHTGMIISEVGEEWAVLRKAPLDEEEMNANMELFCEAFRKYIDLPPLEMKGRVLEEYVGDDDVTQFNRGRINVLIESSLDPSTILSI